MRRASLASFRFEHRLVAASPALLKRVALLRDVDDVLRGHAALKAVSHLHVLQRLVHFPSVSYVQGLGAGEESRASRPDSYELSVIPLFTHIALSSNFVSAMDLPRLSGSSFTAS